VGCGGHGGTWRLSSNDDVDEPRRDALSQSVRKRA